MGGGALDPCGLSSADDQFRPGCTPAIQSEAIANWVEISPFLLDATEVTNHQYRACVGARDCTLPAVTSAGDPGRTGFVADYFNNPDRADSPVVGVDWDQATAYCATLGGRLPTEAEWEFAATTQDAVGGIHGLIGNVREWVADPFDYLAYCAPGEAEHYTDATFSQFPREVDGTPPPDVAGPDHCLDDDNLTEGAGPPGEGCNQRLDQCFGTCTAWGEVARGSTPGDVREAFAARLCDLRLERAAPEGTDCALSGDAACADVLPKDRADCSDHCACVADSRTLAGADSTECMQGCMQAYVSCATIGVRHTYEPARAACLDADVPFVCLDTSNGLGANPKMRVRPACRPRGTQDAPARLYDAAGRNRPVVAQAQSAVQDETGLHHTIRGASFLDDGICSLRPTRRATHGPLAYAGDVGFRCAFDVDADTP